MLETLASAESAWDLAVGPLALPPPDPAPSTGRYDIYLLPRVPGGSTTALDERDVRSSFDRASAFTLLDAKLTGCARDEAIAREMARAILHRVKPSIDTGSALGQSTYLGRLMVPCAAGRLDDTAVFQAHPERALTDTLPEFEPEAGMAYARGAALFYAWMDSSFGAQPGGLVRALWSLSPTISEGARWKNQPSTYDVLRFSFKGALFTGSTIDDVYAGFGNARALVDVPVRSDWDIDWPQKPRRLGPREATAPSGTAYVMVRHAGAPPGARLRVEAAWEQHARMRWSVIKRDAAGRELARVPVASPDRGTEGQGTIVDLDATDSLLIVGVNVGDFETPFNPNDEVWEPHGWLLTVGAAGD
jgi:hypothetical protein